MSNGLDIVTRKLILNGVSPLLTGEDVGILFPTDAIATHSRDFAYDVLTARYPHLTPTKIARGLLIELIRGGLPRDFHMIFVPQDSALTGWRFNRWAIHPRCRSQDPKEYNNFFTRFAPGAEEIISD